MKNIIKLAILIVSASVILSGCGLFPYYFPKPEWEQAEEEYKQHMNAKAEAIISQIRREEQIRQLDEERKKQPQNPDLNPAFMGM